MNSKIKKFNSEGFTVFKNFFNIKECNEFSELIDKKYEQNNFNELENEQALKFALNDKMLDFLNETFGKTYFTHDLVASIDKINYKYTFHRDNPCRRTSYGPDWDKDLNYNVVTAIAYFSDSEDVGSTLRVIKKSHLNKYKYSISNLLRIFFGKTRDTENKYIILLRRIVEKMISYEIKYKSGDLVLFYCNLYHTGGITKIKEFATRKAMVARYGGSGKHTENYANYVLYYRDRINQIQNIKDLKNYKSLLKEKKVFLEIPQEKKNIPHVSNK